jgi:hypothetical protein
MDHSNKLTWNHMGLCYNAIGNCKEVQLQLFEFLNPTFFCSCFSFIFSYFFPSLPSIQFSLLLTFFDISISWLVTSSTVISYSHSLISQFLSGNWIALKSNQFRSQFQGSVGKSRSSIQRLGQLRKSWTILHKSNSYSQSFISVDNE